MRYLITGGAGFIGSNLADKLLENGHDLVIIDNFSDYYDVSIKEKNVIKHSDDPHYKLYRENIENLINIERIFNEYSFDAVIHLAGRAGVRQSLEKPIEYIKTNIIGTVNILECMRRYSVKKLIFASSSSVYGNCEDIEFNEDANVSKPISPYAATKAAGEQFCYTWHHLYGINVIALRFFTVYGPRQRPDLAISKFTKAISEGSIIQMFGDGSTERDYTYIDDIVDGILSALNYDKSSYEIINLGGGQPIQLKQMVNTIERAVNKKAKIEEYSMQPGDVYNTRCSLTKAHDLLGYMPKINFEQGIRNFVRWRKNEEQSKYKK